MPESKSLPLWIFSFGLFPLGLGGFMLGGADIITGLQSRYWTPVPAMVLSSRLESSVFSPEQPDIRYSYEFNKQAFVSNRIWPGKTFAYMPEMRLQWSQGWLERFPEGKAATVYVNPNNPLDVALEPGPTKAIRWMAVFTLFLSLGFWSPWALGVLVEKKFH